jgi:L-aspartate oxidase
MWERVGLVRTGAGLRDALDEIDLLAGELPEGVSPLHNLATVARLVAGAALARPESRGGHYRADHPDTRSAWARRIVLSRSGDREQMAIEPVPSSPTVRQVASA